MQYDNKEIILPKSRNVVLPLIIFSNLFPLYGVINYNWTIFSVVYIYWIELLIITFFKLLRIFIAKGDIHSTFFSKLGLGIKFLVVRLGLFFFYLLFIVVFLGFLASEKSDMIPMVEVIFFKGTFYKITMLSFMLYNLLDFVVHFILNGEYLKSKPDDNFQILDAHVIVVHIVVVLGTFLYKGVNETLHWNHKNTMIACVGLFVAVKILADIIKFGLTRDTPEEQEKFI